MTYARAESFLHALPQFSLEGASALTPGLDRIKALLQEMGDPQKAYPIVHIAGTNGKGSTASFLASILTSSGKKAGLHTSPHLIHLSERLRVDGRPAPEHWIASVVEQYQDVIRACQNSFFEVLVALSLLYFAEEEIDVAVVEVGLGGRLDATNIVSPELAIITSIALDHTQILGDSFRDIAREKAGIIKQGTPVISGVQHPDAVDEIRKIAAGKDAPLVLLEDAVAWKPVGETAGPPALKVATNLRDYGEIELGLHGAYQYKNALLALLAAEMLLDGEAEAEAFIRAGLHNVVQQSGIRGRMEIVREEPLVVLDVGHNSEGLAAALNAISDMLKARSGQLFILFGTMRDKDVHQMARQLSGTGARIFIAPLFPESAQYERTRSGSNISGQKFSSRALPPGELVQILQSCNLDVKKGLDVAEVDDLKQGLFRFSEEATEKDGLLIVGSHYLVAQYHRLTVT